MPRKENAIIMAAGKSSRFVPLSYEIPKGLLRVKGEVLIERQIRQLQEADVTDITVVIGYMQEKFRYLQEKYGVKLVVNTEYDRYNNTSTLMCVLDRISNTYICSSDNYFSENVFMEKPCSAYYAAEYSDGETDEWCMDIDDAGRIKNVTIGGRAAWYMLGHVYFSSQFSECFKKILCKEYELPKTKEELWEKVYLRHIDELVMYARKYETGAILEFDSLHELRKFDDAYVNNTGSKVMRYIAEQFGCEEGDITGIVPIKGRRDFGFFCHGMPFVYRYEEERVEEG